LCTPRVQRIAPTQVAKTPDADRLKPHQRPLATELHGEHLLAFRGRDHRAQLAWSAAKRQRIAELAAERFVLRLEQLVRHPRRLEHRERVGTPIVAERNDASGEEGKFFLRRAYMSMTPVALSASMLK
jgi:hypothetical protein